MTWTSTAPSAGTAAASEPARRHPCCGARLTSVPRRCHDAEQDGLHGRCVSAALSRRRQLTAQRLARRARSRLPACRAAARRRRQSDRRRARRPVRAPRRRAGRCGRRPGHRQRRERNGLSWILMTALERSAHGRDEQRQRKESPDRFRHHVQDRGQNKKMQLAKAFRERCAELEPLFLCSDPYGGPHPLSRHGQWDERELRIARDVNAPVRRANAYLPTQPVRHSLRA